MGHTQRELPTRRASLVVCYGLVHWGALVGLGLSGWLLAIVFLWMIFGGYH